MIYANSYEPKRKLGPWLFIAVLVIAVIAIGVMFGLQALQSRKSNAAGNAFMETLATNDSEAAYNLLSDRLKQQLGDGTVWKSEFKTLYANRVEYTFDGVGKIENTSDGYEKDAKPQRLNYTVSLSNASYSMYVIIVNEKGSFKVDEYNSYRR